MKNTTRLFSLLTALIVVVLSGVCSSSFAQSKATYVGANGTVYTNYHGKGEVAEADDAVYCYQCRAFHKDNDYAYYNNKANCKSDCGQHHAAHSCEGAKCNDCKEPTHEYYNMDHEYDNCGGDYIVKYRNSKVKVKCNSCNAKWKYYYNDYHSNNHYVYDRDDRVIVNYRD